MREVRRLAGRDADVLRAQQPLEALAARRCPGKRPGPRRQQINRLLGLAVRLHEARRDDEAIWFGTLAYCLDPGYHKAAAYLRLLGVPVTVAATA